MADWRSTHAIDAAHEAPLLERHSRFVGIARIPLSSLRLEDGLEFAIHEKNIPRLVDVFKREGVKRLKPDNYVTALVTRGDLDICLQASDLSASAVIQDVNLPFLTVPEGVSFRVIHGQHRLRAAQRTLNVSEGLWWSVGIFDDRTWAAKFGVVC